MRQAAEVREPVYLPAVDFSDIVLGSAVFPLKSITEQEIIHIKSSILKKLHQRHQKIGNQHT